MVPAAISAAGSFCFLAAMVLIGVSGETQPWLRIGLGALTFSANVWGWYLVSTRRQRRNVTG
ncbi:hypothetical protein DMB42_30390 [Nonomuraea sp. WAC 01424]|nr:hypothetical protein DMB42_30390 [Nonomuraea sp. WAC 01424]